jgi:hypothetical protein
MAKKNKIKVPKRIFGFKLSKGTRKDLKKLLKMVEHPQKRAIAMTAAGGLATFLLERFADKKLEPHLQDSLHDEGSLRQPRPAH